MEISQIINALNQTDKLPFEAINFAIERKGEITPFLLNILNEVIDGYQKIDGNRADYIVALFLLAKFKESSAFDAIIRLVNLPDDWSELILGDFIAADLPRLIVSTYDGNLTALKALIENRDAFLWSRVGALTSMVGLISIGKLTREEVIEYYRHLFNMLVEEDFEFATFLVDTSAELYPQELYSDIMNAFDNIEIDSFVIDEEGVRVILENDKEKWLEEVYSSEQYKPIDNVVEDIGWLYDIPENNKVNLDGFAKKFELPEEWKSQEIKEISDVLNNQKIFPYDFIQLIIEQKDKYTPLLLQILDHGIKNWFRIDSDRTDCLMALFLLSKFREPLAFDYVIELTKLPVMFKRISADKNQYSRELARFIISTYNGNIEAIKSIVEDVEQSDLDRAAGLTSFVGLFVTNRLSRYEIIDYFKYLYNSPLIENEFFATTLVGLSYDIYPEELYIDIIKVFNKNLVYEPYISRKSINLALKVKKEDFIEEMVYESKQYMPIDNIIEDAIYLYQGQKEDLDRKDSFEFDCCQSCDSQNNPVKPGRNDFCPCESGKKYKKCCLI